MARVVGVPEEIKDLEGRVSMQPDGVSELVHHGNLVSAPVAEAHDLPHTSQERVLG